MLLRSYSKKPRKASAPWWRQVLRVATAAVCFGAGVPVASVGVGFLLTCIRTGSLLTACTLTYTGVKLTIAGTDTFRKILDEDVLPIERGTTARAWVALTAAVASMTTIGAVLPLLESLVRMYLQLIKFSRGHADDVRFQLQSRKFLVHSADQVERAARMVFGATLTDHIQEQINAAVEVAEGMSRGAMQQMSADEAKRVVMALAVKLTAAYMFCGMVLLCPTVVNLVIAPPISRRLSQLPQTARQRYVKWEGTVQRRAGLRCGTFIAAASQVALLVVTTKPFGLLGERLAAMPTLHVNLRKGVFSLLEVPRVAVKPVSNTDSSSNIPWAVRWFLQ